MKKAIVAQIQKNIDVYKVAGWGLVIEVIDSAGYEAGDRVGAGDGAPQEGGAARKEAGVIPVWSGRRVAVPRCVVTFRVCVTTSRSKVTTSRSKVTTSRSKVTTSRSKVTTSRSKVTTVSDSSALAPSPVLRRPPMNRVVEQARSGVRDGRAA